MCRKLPSGSTLWSLTLPAPQSGSFDDFAPSKSEASFLVNALTTADGAVIEESWPYILLFSLTGYAFAETPMIGLNA